ncbi:MAG: geranylgeranylglyceryl/heptaprenylglyceryl phosphate synthase [Saprospiraceae bacterium]|nr:geranylgeranylglyceryl/heptaprenylglyceryl phosphate synthase [Saprospiraceae bacterium]
MATLYAQLLQKKQRGQKSLAILIDPDKNKLKNLDKIIELANVHGVGYFFVGGSLLSEDHVASSITRIKSESNIPIVLFPGNNYQIDPGADALLFLSLVSGRNPEYLISKHVEAALKIAETNLEVIATAYLLINGGHSNTAAYLSQTLPIPHDKTEIAVATAMACKFLNFQCIYLEAGSGAKIPVASEMIKAVSNKVNLPLIVGGGLKSCPPLELAYQSGADLAVVGNEVETNPDLIKEMMVLVRTFDFKNAKA